MPRYNWRMDEKKCTKIRPYLLKSLVSLTRENPNRYYRPKLFAHEARKFFESTGNFLYDRDVPDLIQIYIDRNLINQTEIQHRTRIDIGYQANLMKIKELESIIENI